MSWLVFSLDCIRVWKEMVVELSGGVTESEVSVIKITTWATKIVLNVVVFPLVEVTFWVDMLKLRDWTLVLERNLTVKFCVLNRWFNLE